MTKGELIEILKKSITNDDTPVIFEGLEVNDSKELKEIKHHRADYCLYEHKDDCWKSQYDCLIFKLA